MATPQHGNPVKLLGVGHYAKGKDQDPQPELWHLIERSVKDAADQLLAHFETLQPRHEDLDIAHNRVDDGKLDTQVTTIPNQSFTAVNGTPKVFKIVARPGWVAHIKRLRIFPLNPTQSFVAVAVKAEYSGRTIQNIADLDYRRPVMLDRDDVLTVTITNTSGGDLVLAYALDGWLRANKQNIRC